MHPATTHPARSLLSAVTTADRPTSTSSAVVGDAVVSLADDLHDLLVGLLGDETVAATATIDVVLRTTARVRDGDHHELDRSTLLGAAVTHAAVLAEGRHVRRSASDVLDLAVLDLVDRRGIDGRGTADIADVRHRSIPQRRARALRIVAGVSQTPAEAGRLRAGAPLAVAPRTVHDAVDQLLAGVPDTIAPPRSRTRAIAAAVAAVIALVAIAIGTPRLVGEATAPSAVVVGEPVEFTPVPSTGVVVEGETGTRVASDESGADAPDGAAGETAAEGGPSSGQG